MKFVTLTAPKGQKIRLNLDLMESYGTITEKTYKGADDYVGLTYLVPVGMPEEGRPYVVTETPKEIDAMIYF